MTSPFCDHGRVAERCPQCEVVRLKELALQIAERLYLAAEVLAIKAERKDRRNLDNALDLPSVGT